MKNRDWLNSTAMIDRFKLLIENNLNCPLVSLGVPDSVTDGRCDVYDVVDKRMNEVCYDCVAAWLNEEKTYDSFH